jgi:hypothetical protein
VKTPKIALQQETVARLVAYLDDRQDKMAALLLAELQQTAQNVEVEIPATNLEGAK